MSTVQAVRGSAKRDAVVVAATSAFLTHGYEASSMDAIAAEAGVSKRTVYNHFPGKRELFQAVVSGLYEGFHSDGVQTLRQDQPPEQALPAFLRSLLVHLRRPEVRGLLRLVIAEHQRFPELSQDYLDGGKSHAYALLDAYIAGQHAQGRLHAPDPHSVATQLLGGIKEVLFWPTMLGLPVAADPDQVITESVAALVRAHGRPDGALSRSASPKG
ncbi:TetR/AcrR family transcriptional regulator [Azospirillum picis]|uniref:TetR/AcrR family transcriptional regulator of autoinduction and epiphytic fitness n=1 Tax=Azospirillum picis TaxID=488438 RepID=A0ABU0MG33_9PROT|nr:TetR/AcrR family transcriptional regulator [Azospirillum picis]MBP2298544.1 TetR/AcrR family transcriptional regulator of autoinduction and epiphytic fitness [Azospirillum picis]MDQ0532407.1 TetR/AcrR family transcriptional regulator of autoinduction and epiphytic fitness [Azospirillum picis]